MGILLYRLSVIKAATQKKLPVRAAFCILISVDDLFSCTSLDGFACSTFVGNAEDFKDAVTTVYDALGLDPAIVRCAVFLEAYANVGGFAAPCGVLVAVEICVCVAFSGIVHVETVAASNFSVFL